MCSTEQETTTLEGNTSASDVGERDGGSGEFNDKASIGALEIDAREVTWPIVVWGTSKV